MPTFLVEFFFPGSRRGTRAEIAERVERACTALAREGVPVRLLHAVSIPTDELYLCFFEAPSNDAVLEAARRAELPVEAGAEQVDFVPLLPGPATTNDTSEVYDT